MKLKKNLSFFFPIILVFSVSLCLCGQLHAQQPALTTVQDTVYRSDGTLASGSVVVSWSPFISADNRPVFGGTKTATLTNGALAISLIPNAGGTPSGTSYKVEYYQSGGVYFTETWVVPSSSPLASPGAPAVGNAGAAGTTTYCYWITATKSSGETLLGPVACTTTGNATLSGTNYNTVSWSAVAGATGYNVYRTSNSTAPTGTGSYKVGSTAGTSLNDQSNSLTSATIPTLNTTDPRTLSQVRVTVPPSPSVIIAASQVTGGAIVGTPSGTQTITAPGTAGVIPLRVKGNATANADVLEIFDSAGTPVLQGYFDSGAALHLNKAPTFSAMTQGSCLFAGANGIVAQDNANCFWDNTNKRLGIGTAAPQFQVHVSNASTADIIGDGYSSGGGRFIGRMARGNASSPSAVQTDDIIASFGGRGYGATGFSNNRGLFGIQAAENWTDTTQGAYFTFNTTAIGSTTLLERMRVADNGNVGIGTSAPSSLLSVGPSSQFQVNSSGVVAKYNNAATQGVGLATFLYSSDRAAQVAAITDATMFTVGGSTSVFRFSGTINCTTASASATATLNLKWTDSGSQAQTQSVTATCTALGAASMADQIHTIRAKNGTAITYGVTVANTPTYDVSVRLEQL